MTLRSFCLAGMLVGSLAAAAKAPAMHVSGWAGAGLRSSAAYLTIHNGSPTADRLVAVSSPAASTLTLHNSSMAGGVMRMRPAGAVPIAAGGQLSMKPGGLHVMVTGLRAPLRVGSKLPLTLRFARAGNVQVSVPVVAPGSRPSQEAHHGH